jgi:hypothetical protein
MATFSEPLEMYDKCLYSNDPKGNSFNDERIQSFERLRQEVDIQNFYQKLRK